MDKVFVLGDSHAIALADGVKALGLSPAMAYLSGNEWHAGAVRFHRRLGVIAPGRPGFQRRMRAGFAHLEIDSLLDGNHVVIASVGYQLGRLVPPLLRAGHAISGVSTREATHMVSQGFVARLVQERRSSQFQLLRKLSRRCRIVVVSPPVMTRSPEDDHIRTLIGNALHQAGAEVFDTRELLPEDGTVEESERHEDGAHGNAAYGQRVVEAVRDRFFADVSLAG